MVSLNRQRIYTYMPNYVFNIVEEVLRRLNVQISNVDINNRRFYGTYGPSLLSWGEDIQIQILPHRSGSLVNVTTSSLVGFNIFASGKLEENITNFFNLLEQML